MGAVVLLGLIGGKRLIGRGGARTAWRYGAVTLGSLISRVFVAGRVAVGVGARGWDACSWSVQAAESVFRPRSTSAITVLFVNMGFAVEKAALFATLRSAAWTSELRDDELASILSNPHTFVIYSSVRLQNCNAVISDAGVVGVVDVTVGWAVVVAMLPD